MKTNLSKRIPALLLTVILLIGLLPVGIFADAQTLQSDGSGGYYLNMPSTGTHTLDLSDKAVGFSFKLYDNGGASGNYSNYCDSALVITAPAGKYLSVSGSGEAEVWNNEYADYLTLYDEATSLTLGTAKYGGVFTVNQVVTSGAQLRVCFYSDYASAKSGFDLTVTIVDPSDTVTLSFLCGTERRYVKVIDGSTFTMPSGDDLFTIPTGKDFFYWEDSQTQYLQGDTYLVNGNATFMAVLIDNVVTLYDNGAGGYCANMPVTGDYVLDISDRSGDFSFTLYDDGGPDDCYSFGCDGLLLIKAPAGTLLSVSGGGTTVSVTGDYLTFYDGDTSTVLGDEKYGGVFSIQQLVTSGNELKVYFKSAINTSHTGFELDISIVSPSNVSALTFVNGTETVTRSVVRGSTYDLPVFTDLFTLPAGKHFDHWLRGSDEYAEGYSYTVNGNATFTAVLSYNYATLSSNDNGYYLNMPIAESYYLDLSDKSVGFSFTLYDDGGEEGNYSNDCDGSVLITAPAGTVLCISGSGVAESTSFDWLSIYDGDTSTTLGDAKYGNAFSVPELFSAGNVLKVCFHSDNTSTRTGFALNVTVADPSSVRVLTFVYGEEVQTVSVINGTVCVLPAFTDLFTMPSTKHFVHWLNGADTYAAGDNYTVSGNTTFTGVLADNVAALSPDGSGGYYMDFFVTGNYIMDLSDKESGFSFTLYDDGGANGNYSNDCSCTLLMTAQPGFVFIFGGGGSTNAYYYDYLTFYDGDTTTVLGNSRYGGASFTVPDMTTSDNALKILFYSNSTNNESGFALNVTVVDASDLAELSFGCNGYSYTVPTIVGTSYTLPSFGAYFSLPEGKRFAGWSDGSSVYPAGSSYSVTGDVSFDAVLADEPVPAQDGNGNWYARMYQTTTVNVDLTDKPAGFTMTVYDNGGPDGDYANGSSSYMLITAPAGCLLRVSGGGEAEIASNGTAYDYLTIYDGDGDTVLGAAKNSGVFTVDETTSGNVLKIYFYSNSSTVKSGFALNVTVLDASACAVLTYSYLDQSKSQALPLNGVITLPAFTDLFALPAGATFEGWQNGGVTYDAGDSYTLTADTTFTAVVSYDNVLQEDGNGGYYVLMPASGTVPVDLTGKSAGFSFVLYDDGGPDGQYSNNCDGAVLITAPAGCLLSIGGDGVTESPKYDYLIIYDGTGSTVLGDANYANTFTISEMFTTGDTLKVFFHSDNSVQKNGFALTVTVCAASSLCVLTYDAGAGSGTMQGLTVTVGTPVTVADCGFTLPENTYFVGYTDGTNTYQPGDTIVMNGNVTLTALYADIMTVVFSDLAGADYTINVARGSEIVLPAFADHFETPYRKVFLGWLTGGVTYAQGDSYTVNDNVTFTAVYEELPILISDGQGGWFAYMPKYISATLDLSDKQPGFTFTLYDDGILGEYSRDISGDIRIIAPEGCVLRLNGCGATEAGDDVLHLYDGAFLRQLGDYEGVFETGDLFSTGDTATVWFESDDDNNAGEGFELTVTVIDPSTLITISYDAGAGSGTMDPVTVIVGESFFLPESLFTPPSGYVFDCFKDPAGNRYYPGNIATYDTDTTLTANYGQAVTLTFTYEGVTESVDVLMYSHGSLPEFTDFFTLPNGLCFAGWYCADEATTYDEGADLYYTENMDFEALLDTAPVLRPDGEGGWYANMPVNDTAVLDLTDKEAGFTFKVYDDGGKDGDYVINNVSYLEITVPSGMRLTFSGSGSTESKSYDYLIFYDGIYNGSVSVPKIGADKYGGANTSSNAFTVEELMSSANTMTVYFVSDYSKAYSGFELTFEIVDLCEITYSDGSTTHTELVDRNEWFALAAYTSMFTLEEGDEFRYWNDGEYDYPEGYLLYAYGDMTFTADVRPIPRFIMASLGAIAYGTEDEDWYELLVPAGTAFKLPHPSEYFDVPADWLFAGWLFDGYIHEPGEVIYLEEDIDATAYWEDLTPWDQLVWTLADGEGTDMGTIVLEEDLIAQPGSRPLVVPEDTTVTIDLAGYTVDGTNTNIYFNGIYLIVKGDLTIIDSEGGGTVCGGGVQQLFGATIDAPAAIEETFEAAFVQNYRYYYDSEWHYENYATVLMPTLAEAFGLLEIDDALRNYQSDIAPGSNTATFVYDDPQIVLLADATVAQGECLEANTHYPVELDLNGFTFDVQGIFCGSWISSSHVTQMTDLSIYSTVPGTFRVSGVLAINLFTATEDQFVFTGGDIYNNVTAYGGNYTISSGVFSGEVLFNNGYEFDLNVSITGNAIFEHLAFEVETDEGSSSFAARITGNVSVYDLQCSIDGDLSANTSAVSFGGGYYNVDPAGIMGKLVKVTTVDHSDMSRYFVYVNDQCLPYDPIRDQAYTGDYYEIDRNYYAPFYVFDGPSEEYSGQDDWAADSSLCRWRVTSGSIYDLDGNGEINITDVTVLLNVLTGSGSAARSCDLDGNGEVNIGDVTVLLNVLATV